MRTREPGMSPFMDDDDTYHSIPAGEWQVNAFIDGLRNALAANLEEDNCFRFLTGGKEIDIEKSKSLFKRPAGSVTLLAINQTIERFYTVHETFESRVGRMEPANQSEISVSFEEKKMVYDYGFIELTNNVTGNHVMLQITTDEGPPYFKAYALKNTGEAHMFVERVHNNEKLNNIYHKKTFGLEYKPYMGLVPKFIENASVSEEDVIISKDIADEIQQNVIDVFERAQDYRDAKIPTKRGVLMEGPPGNGKSTLVKYINSRLKGEVTFIYVSDGIIQSADQITTVFEYAREYAPAIVVFEDIDTIGGSRDMGRNNFTSELLTQLDGLEKLEDFVIIATTNFANLIDDALKNRPARFDRRILVERPSARLREAMLTKFLRQRDVKIGHGDITYFSSDRKTKDFSGAHLQEVVITAKMIALHRREVANENHIEEAIAFVKGQYHDDKKITSKNDRLGFRGENQNV